MPGKQDLLSHALRYSGAHRVLRMVGTWRGLVVLNYHRIGEGNTSEFDHGVFSATQPQFADQLRLIARHCDVIGIRDLDRAVLDRRGRYALITFDDGYRDNYELAFPVLRDQRLPATFFITTGFLDDGLIAWWDEIAWMVRRSANDRLPANRWTGAELNFDPPHRESTVRRLLRVYKGLPGEQTGKFLDWLAEATGSGRCPPETVRSLWMSWDMLRAMRAAGMDVGGHTVNHPILARHTPGEQWQEIQGSKQRIESELGEPIEAFSYPVGQPDSFDATTQDLLRRAGYRWGFSFHGGFVHGAGLNPFSVPRLSMDPHITPSRLASLLTLPQLFATR